MVGGVITMAKKANNSKKQMQKNADKTAGYGDKKLEGPNRPAE